MCLQTKPYAPALAVVACALGGRVGAMASVRDMYHCIDALVAMITQGCRLAATPHGDVLVGEVHGAMGAAADLYRSPHPYLQNC